MASCADCVKKYCCSHQLEHLPIDCPTSSRNPDEIVASYEAVLASAQAAAQVEAESFREKLTRVEDIMLYAQKCGYGHLGIAFCSGLAAEAKTLAKILRHNGFQVSSAICKNGSVPKECLDIEDKDKIRPGQFEALCNPIGQAYVLDKDGSQLNIVLGLCVGHDTLFFQHSKAPVTVLATKDRALGHNAIAALYTADSYYTRLYETCGKATKEKAKLDCKKSG